MYKLKKNFYIFLTMFLVIGLLWANYGETLSDPLTQFLGNVGGILWIIFGFPYHLACGYKTDEKGVYSLYSFKGKVLKIRTFIPWEDVKKVLMGGGQRVHVYPELQPGYKLKDYIVINQNTVKYKELVQTIVDRAKNAEVENTVKVWLESRSSGGRE